MYQTKKAKSYLVFGIIFGILALFFALMYHFNIIKTLDLFLAVTYVVYFAGLTLIYNGAYCKETNKKTSKSISYFIGLLFILLAIIMLVFGFSTGRISFFL